MFGAGAGAGVGTIGAGAYLAETRASRVKIISEVREKTWTSENSRLSIFFVDVRTCRTSELFVRPSRMD